MSHECVRCHKDSIIAGFCPKCYWEVYGFTDKDKIEYIHIDEIKVKEEHLDHAKREKHYSEIIKESIKINGQEICPLILDKDNFLLIGHHRYNIYRDLGYEQLAFLRLKEDIDLSMFMEGEGGNLFIIRKDGKLFASTSDYREIFNMMLAWNNATPYWQESSFIVECYINLGMDKKYTDEASE